MAFELPLTSEIFRCFEVKRQAGRYRQVASLETWIGIGWGNRCRGWFMRSGLLWGTVQLVLCQFCALSSFKVHSSPWSSLQLLHARAGANKENQQHWESKKSSVLMVCIGILNVVLVFVQHVVECFCYSPAGKHYAGQWKNWMFLFSQGREGHRGMVEDGWEMVMASSAWWRGLATLVLFMLELCIMAVLIQTSMHAEQ